MFQCASDSTETSAPTPATSDVPEVPSLPPPSLRRRNLLAFVAYQSTNTNVVISSTDDVFLTLNSAEVLIDATAIIAANAGNGLVADKVAIQDLSLPAVDVRGPEGLKLTEILAEFVDAQRMVLTFCINSTQGRGRHESPFLMVVR
jgi:hypothetical protein